MSNVAVPLVTRPVLDVVQPHRGRRDARGLDLYLEAWLAQKAAGTARAYSRTGRQLRAYLEEHGPMSVHEIELPHLMEFLVGRKRDVMHNTYRRDCASVRSLFGFLYEQRFIDEPVHKGIRVPAAHTNVSDRILWAKQRKRVMKSAKNPRAKLIMKTIFRSGMRVTECLTLKKSGVDLEYDGEEGQTRLSIMGKAKDGGRPRNVFIPRKLAQTLLKNAHRDSEYVFSTRSGKPISRQQVDVWIKAAAKACGHKTRASAHIAAALSRNRVDQGWNHGGSGRTQSRSRARQPPDACLHTCFGSAEQRRRDPGRHRQRR
jgi:site-specific recombinase XerD